MAGVYTSVHPSTYRYFEKSYANWALLFEFPSNTSQKVSVHLFHRLLLPGDLILFWIPPRRRPMNSSRSEPSGWGLSFHKVPANLLPSNPCMGTECPGMTASKTRSACSSSPREQGFFFGSLNFASSDRPIRPSAIDKYSTVTERTDPRRISRVANNGFINGNGIPGQITE